MLNTNAVESLFELFSGHRADEAQQFITLAVAEVKKILVPDVPETDERLNFLYAATANYRFQQAKAAGDSSIYTYAGKMADSKKNTPLYFAESLLRDYYQLFRDIIKPQNFVFMGFSKECELDD